MEKAARLAYDGLTSINVDEPASDTDAIVRCELYIGRKSRDDGLLTIWGWVRNN